MAVGNLATNFSTAQINAQIAQDAQQVQAFIQWAQKKYTEYNANLSTTAQQTAAGFSAAGDQATITTFIGNLNRIQTWLTGGTGIALGENVLQDCVSITGIQ